MHVAILGSWIPTSNLVKTKLTMYVCAGIDRLYPEFAAAIVVRAEGRSLHCFIICPSADAHGGHIVRPSAQRHALHGNVRLLFHNLTFLIKSVWMHSLAKINRPQGMEYQMCGSERCGKGKFPLLILKGPRHLAPTTRWHVALFNKNDLIYADSVFLLCSKSRSRIFVTVGGFYPRTLNSMELRNMSQVIDSLSLLVMFTDYRLLNVLNNVN